MPWVRWVTRCEWRGVELILASWALWWGLWLLAPWWGAFSSSPTFSVMLGIAREEIWGAVPALCGLALLLGSLRQHREIRRWSLLALSLTWLMLWASLALANWQSTATPVYLHLAILCAMCYLRLHRAQR